MSIILDPDRQREYHKEILYQVAEILQTTKYAAIEVRPNEKGNTVITIEALGDREIFPRKKKRKQGETGQEPPNEGKMV